MAPGNAIRQASVGAGPGVLKALVYSFAYGAYNIADSTTFPVAVMWIALLPVFYRIAISSGLKFRFPAAAIIFFYCVYCAQGTPVFYAQGIHMPYRMMNIIYFARAFSRHWFIPLHTEHIISRIQPPSRLLLCGLHCFLFFTGLPYQAVLNSAFRQLLSYFSTVYIAHRAHRSSMHREFICHTA